MGEVVTSVVIGQSAGRRDELEVPSLDGHRPAADRTEHAGVADYGRKVTLMVIRVSTGTSCSSVGS